MSAAKGCGPDEECRIQTGVVAHHRRRQIRRHWAVVEEEMEKAGKEEEVGMAVVGKGVAIELPILPM